MPILSHNLPDRRFGRSGPEKLKNLHPRHKEIIRLLSTGLNNKAVSRQLDVTAQNVSDVANSEVGARELARLSAARDSDAERFLQRTKELSLKALDIMDQMMGGVEISPTMDSLEELSLPPGFEARPTSTATRKEIALNVFKETAKIVSKDEPDGSLLTKDDIIAIRDAYAKYEDITPANEE